MYNNQTRRKGKRKAFGKLSGNRPIVRDTAASLSTKQNLKSILKSPKKNAGTTTPHTNTTSTRKKKQLNGNNPASKDDVTPLVNNTTKNKLKALKGKQHQNDSLLPIVTAPDDYSVATHELEEKVENIFHDAVTHGAMEESDHDMDLSSGGEEESSCASHVTRSTTQSATAVEAQSVACYSAISELTYSVVGEQTEESLALPPGWIIRYSRSKNGKPYYCNPSHGIKTWDHPARLASHDGESEEESDNTSSLEKSPNEANGGQNMLIESDSSLNSLATRNREDYSNSGQMEKGESTDFDLSNSTSSKGSFDDISEQYEEQFEEEDDDFSIRSRRKSLPRPNTGKRNQSPWAVYLKTKTVEKGRSEAKKERILLGPICSLQSLDLLQKTMNLRKQKKRRRKSLTL